MGIKNKKLKDGLSFRGAEAWDPNSKISNFENIFGCDPAEGVISDTNFVKIFIEHLKGLFSPEDGSVLFPDCLGTIDSINGNVNFESTSSKLGKKLLLFRQDNRVGTRHLIVLNKDELQENDKKILVKKDIKSFEEAFENCAKKTQYFINFFIKEIGFKKDEVLFIGEGEAR